MAKAYAYRSLECDFDKSTSGGAFTKIVRSFFDKGPGIVYGVVVDNDMLIKHSRATTFEDCLVFRGSKYVRSKLSNIFELISNDLCNSNRVLFSGTPCQVDALYKYLAKQNVSINDLFTIDLICNGAPSQSIWQNYVEWVESRVAKKMVDFTFRSKVDKNNPYLATAVFDDNSKLSDNPLTACYNRLFLKKLIVPQSCFDCKFKSEIRVSDITLGDFWGSNILFSDPLLKDGVSLVLTNTAKGEMLFCWPSHSKEIIFQCKNKDYLKYQENLRGFSKVPKEYNSFWSDYRNHGFGYVANKYADSDFPKSIKYYFRRLYRNVKACFNI